MDDYDEDKQWEKAGKQGNKIRTNIAKDLKKNPILKILDDITPELYPDDDSDTAHWRYRSGSDDLERHNYLKKELEKMSTAEKQDLMNKYGRKSMSKRTNIYDDWKKWTTTGIPPWDNEAFKDKMEAKQLRKAMEAGGQGINVHKDSWNASLQAKAMKEAQMAAMANEANRIAKEKAAQMAAGYGANPPKGNPDYYKAMLLNDAQKDLFPKFLSGKGKLQTAKPGFNWRMLKNPWLAAAAGLGAAGTYFWPEDEEPYGKAGAYGDDTMSQRRLAYRGPLALY